MADILEEIVAHKRIEIEQRKRFIQPRQMITLTEQKMQENGGKVMGGSMGCFVPYSVAMVQMLRERFTNLERKENLYMMQ